MRHWRGLLTSCAVFLASCSMAHLTPNQPVVIANDAETESAEGEVEAPQVWTYSVLLRSLLPVTPDELDDLRAESLYSASVHGRLVWLDLHGKSARQELAEVQGPVSITLGNLSPELLQRVDDVAKHYPVAIRYEPPVHAPQPADTHSSDEEAAAAQQDLSALGSLRHVQALVLSATVSDEFPDLRQCTGLKHLEVLAPETQGELYERLPTQLEELVVGSVATTGSPKALLRLTKLRRLELSNSRELALRDLTPLKALEDLTLGDYLRDEDLKHLTALPKLRRFITASPLTNEALRYLARLPRLRALGLRQSQLDDDGATQLAQLTQLEELTPPQDLHTDSLPRFRALKNLKTLDLHDSNLGDSGLQYLTTLTKLETLDVGRCTLTDSAARSIEQFTNLRSVDLSSSSVGDDTARAIGTLTKLRRLNLQNTGITNAAVPALLNLKELRVLHVNTTNLDGDAFIALLALPKLHRYYASTGEADLRAVDRIRGDLRLIDYYLIDCEHRRVRLPESECEDN
ncbi:MAG: hypothetical protein AB7K71_06205 [Polyangiaceae bacterium]